VGRCTESVTLGSLIQDSWSCHRRLKFTKGMLAEYPANKCCVGDVAFDERSPVCIPSASVDDVVDDPNLKTRFVKQFGCMASYESSTASDEQIL
jgi:hypothetical protein